MAYDKFLVGMANMRNIDVLVTLPTMRLGCHTLNRSEKFITSWCMKKLTNDDAERVIKQFLAIPCEFQSSRADFGSPAAIIELTEEEKKAILESTFRYDLVQTYTPVEDKTRQDFFNSQKILLVDDNLLKEKNDVIFLHIILPIVAQGLVKPRQVSTYGVSIKQTKGARKIEKKVD